MASIYPRIFFKNTIVPSADAHVHVASSAVLYGLSVYTVFPVMVKEREPKPLLLKDHFTRLINSAKIIGIDTFEQEWDFERFEKAVAEVIRANNIEKLSFARATVHVTDLVPGTRSRGLHTEVSIFIYEANPIVPQTGARLKTSVWRRVPDYAIPSRAKVNGAYVNSVLGKQDAIDSGYDDCIFLDTDGHVCELSAANIFIVRNGTLITPSSSSDILEGITRKIVFGIAKELQIPILERTIDLTELYVADEIFACGTSSFVAPVIEIDARQIGSGSTGPITEKIRAKYQDMLGI